MEIIKGDSEIVRRIYKVKVHEVLLWKKINKVSIVSFDTH